MVTDAADNQARTETVLNSGLLGPFFGWAPHVGSCRLLPMDSPRSPKPSTGHRPDNYGQGVAAIDDAEQSLVDGRFLQHRLKETFASPDYKPPALPAVALELLALSRKPEVSFAAVRKLMERDPILAGRVLVVAQSAAFASAGVVRSLEDALLRLGLRTLGDIVIEAALSTRVFRAEGYTDAMRALSRHSTVVAHLARHIARRTAIYDEHAFLCGLLHDVGAAAGMIVLGERPRGEPLLELDLVWPAILAEHESVSASLCRAWNLPAEVGLVVGNHHGCQIGGHVHPVAAVVHLADWVSAQLGESEETPGELSLAPALRALGVAPEALRGLVDEGRGIVAKVPR